MHSLKRRYGPFGEVLDASGTYAAANPIRFSTKYEDSETGLDDYGYRYYQSSTGRWISADPTGEAGGINLYAFVENQPTNLNDPLGLAGISQSGLLSMIQQRINANKDKKCPCPCQDKGEMKISISGNIINNTTVQPSVDGGVPQGNSCIVDPQIWFFDCYSNAWFNENPHSKYASPGAIKLWLNINDPWHLNMEAVLIYDRCDHMKLTTHAVYSNELSWTWNKAGQNWTDLKNIPSPLSP